MRSWVCGDKIIPLGETTAIMGIVNTTPDSFSDGGNLPTLDAALTHALALADAGATIIDIGGESSRPGATPVDLPEEHARTIPLNPCPTRGATAPAHLDRHYKGRYRAGSP